MINYLFASTILILSCSIYLRTKRRLLLKAKLIELKISAEEKENEINWQENTFSLKYFSDHLGKAGYLKANERTEIIIVLSCFTLALSFMSLYFTYNKSISLMCFFFFISFYFGVCLSLLFLKYKAKDVDRKVLFEIPIFLESLILLVESGLGILPAIEKCVESKKQHSHSQLNVIIQLIYNYSSKGMSFSMSLETLANALPYRVLRHVLLHLDISNSEGGEIIPSLRNLSDHAHKEWNLSVEQRVKQLENFVVFPVFTAVIGLMLLVSAVPIVPLLDLKNNLENSAQIPTPDNNNFDNHFRAIK
ncbi:MAG: type II secretion system F family protein [Proteobacteria bacterium]|nr:type II secretion system F family protein [Pseudomonadota bacterium]